VASYAFPLFATGSLMLCGGLAVCSYTVEAIGVEKKYWRLKTDWKQRDLKAVWLQQSQTQGGTSFPAYAVYRNPNAREDIIRTSHKAERPSKDSSKHAEGNLHTPEWSVTTAVAFAVIGYVLQFIGFRGMNYFTSVISLVATVLMSAVRAFVRRGLSNEPHAEKLAAPSGHEHDRFVLDVMDRKDWSVVTGFQSRSKDTDEIASTTSEDGLVHRVFEMRTKLASITTWNTSTDHISDAIWGAIRKILKDSPSIFGEKIENCEFEVPVSIVSFFVNLTHVLVATKDPKAPN